MKLETLVVGPLEENCYVAYDEITLEAFIIDPGAEADRIIALIDTKNLKPKLIVNTHGHWDHIGAVMALKEKYQIPFYLHEDDFEWLKEPLASFFGPSNATEVVVDRTIKNGDEIYLGTKPMRVIHTPGHTKGGCVLWFMNDDIALTGDTLFKGTVGRTDFPGGSYSDILYSIQARLAPLGDECEVYPGHGPKSNMDAEREHNPYMRYDA